MTDYSWDSTVPAQVEERSFEVPPIGEYNFIVVSAEKTFSQSSGNPMLKVRLDLQGADGSVFDNLVLTDNSMFKVVTFLESIGLKQKGEELKMSIGEAADKAKGLEGRVKIKHELYKGENRAKVDHYIIPEAKKAAKKPTKKAEKLPEIADDDLPFEI